MFDRAEIQRVSDQLLTDLAQAITARAAIDAAVARACREPAGSLVVRMHGYEVLAAASVIAIAPSPATARELAKARETYRIDLSNPRARLADTAYGALASQLGLAGAAPAIAIGEPPAPWLDFGDWAADRACLALPVLAASGAAIAGRGLDVTRAATLALLEQDHVRAVALARWAPWCGQARLGELLGFVAERDRRPFVAFAAALVGAA